MKTKKVITADNSPTLYVPELDEHYHSINGAVQESQHVFINAGLKYIDKKEINLLEIGFGTGLNAALSFELIKKTKQQIYYETIEKYPLSMDTILDLKYSNIDQEFYNKIHVVEWEKTIPITENFNLKKINTDLKEYNPDKAFDIIYFDAFAPEKQPDLWTESIFAKLFEHTKDKGYLLTFSAKGIVKQALRNVGYKVQRLQGPPGKRHIIRAIKK